MTFQQDRRSFLTQTATAALVGLSGATGVYARPTSARPAKIVLRSSWQTVNIGDIAHTPGVLHLLEQHLPDAEVRLWPSKIDAGVKELLGARFPKLTFVEGEEAQQAALKECDFFLHSSGPALVGRRDLARWRRETEKPYGIYGITQGPLDAETTELLGGAEFAFFRDSLSLKRVKDAGIAPKTIDFAPDGAFACDLADDRTADAFLRASGLEAGKFLCAIPRLRYTPYWLVHPREMTAEDKRKHPRNEQMKEHDHAPLRAAIEAVVRQTDMKVLICPEDRSQIAVGKELLYDRLPADVRAKVVWRDRYWLTDEACSVYRKSAGLFGLEMHSPILCVGSGVPAIVGRFEEQTSKGFMWRDIGAGDWLFDFDVEADIERYVPAVLAMAQDPTGARKKSAGIRADLLILQDRTMEVVDRAVDLAVLRTAPPGKLR